MNSIRQIQELNKRELENGVSPEASWHADYRDTAYIYIGGLPFELSEGDIITMFSQFGEPTYVKLVRDKETGKSRGFAFLKYEDQRSTDLAVDNLGGALIMGRTLKVDHTRYKKRDDESDDGTDMKNAIHETQSDKGDGSEGEDRPILPEEQELAKLIREHDEDDPMKAFLVEDMKEKLALARVKVTAKEPRGSKSRDSHHRHRSRRESEKDGPDEKRRSHYRSTKSSHRRDDSREKGADSRRDHHRRKEGEDSRHKSGRRASRDRRDRSRSVDSDRRQRDDDVEDRRYR